MNALSFIKSIADNLLYLFWKDDILTLIIVIWINSMIISSHYLTTIWYFKTYSSGYFDITNLRELRSVFGILVEHNHTSHLIYLSQEFYLKKVLKHFGVANAHLVSISFMVETVLSFLQSLQNLKDLHKFQKYSNRIHYLFLVDSVLYTMQTHSNIQFVVG